MTRQLDVAGIFLSSKRYWKLCAFVFVRGELCVMFGRLVICLTGQICSLIRRLGKLACGAGTERS